MLPPMGSSEFDWIAWRNGNPFKMFGIPARTASILQAKDTLQTHAVGWCRGEDVPCRPKVGTIAVMFYVDTGFGWFHLTEPEFQKVFCDA